MGFPIEMTKRLRGLAFWALSIASVYGQIKTGPSVGQQVPAFSGQDQEARTQSLKSIMGPKGALIVFFRSADW